MPVRDLGYRPYEGERLPSSHNTWVLLRHGLRRAWASWLVKIAVFLGWVPTAIFVGVVFVQFRMAQEAPPEMVEGLQAQAGPAVANLLGWQMWLFATMASLGAGAGAIAEDLTHRAFQFYFAKPVTPEQYLAGRVVAVAGLCFALLLLPALLSVATVASLAPPEERLARAGLLLPAVLSSAVVAVTLGTVSVAVSSLSRSRALTMSAWVMVFVIPEVLSTIVTAVGDWPWLGLLSLPTLLGTVGIALFKMEPPTDLRWFHAVPALAIWVGAGTALALARLRRAEVIT
ncbi:MAG: ABC transporter permease subunit [Myxococcota bacterium]